MKVLTTVLLGAAGLALTAAVGTGDSARFSSWSDPENRGPRLSPRREMQGLIS
jgi:hypothetical protein